MGMLNSHRQARTPTSATSPATIAVATPPPQSAPASTPGRAGRGGGPGMRSGGPGGIGLVIVLASPSFRQAVRFARAVVSPSPAQASPNTGAVSGGAPTTTSR